MLGPETPEYKVGRAPQRSQASSGHCSSACLPSRCPEGSLGLGLLSLCLQTLRRALGLGDKRSLVHMSLALDTELLLSLQVVHTYLKQTSKEQEVRVMQGKGQESSRMQAASRYQKRQEKNSPLESREGTSLVHTDLSPVKLILGF